LILTIHNKKRKELAVSNYIFYPVLAGLIVPLYYAVRVALYYAAKWNKLVTLPTENEIITVLKGNQFDHFILSSEKRFLNADHTIGKENPKIKSLSGLLRWAFRKAFGVEWVGILPWRVFEYDFSWIKYAKSAGEVLTLLQRLNQEYKKTIVMVTHDPHAAERAGHILHLEKGTLVEQVPAGG